MKTIKTINHTKALIAIAIFQLMRHKEYENISVKEICDKAGVSRMSFYRYYSMKDDVFIDFCDARFEEFYSQYDGLDNIEFKEFTLSLFQFFKKYYRQLLILKRAKKQLLLINQFNSYSSYLLQKMAPTKQDEYRNNPVIATFFAGGIFNVLMKWLDNGMQETPEEMNEYLCFVLKQIQVN